ncbi:MAG: hypothetical protein J3R72DRAFT_434809 [Linnemannia gamsii]|nr:MAG: hypothetical protein J3R72DRAFT_434809 [Linnemannia gamsii]
MLGSGPGPAPTPSMTLPPLRDLDKALGPESEHNRLANHHHSVPSGHQPRSQSSDPHLHHNFQQQQRPQQQSSQQAQQQHQYTQKLPTSQHGYQHHDQPSQYPLLSRPGVWIAREGQDEAKDLYMSATRTDSVSSKDYSPHGHSHRHLPAASAHEPGPGRSDSNSGHQHPHPQSQQHQQQQSRPESKSPTSANTASSATVSSKTSAQAGSSTGATTVGSADGSNAGKTTSEQGRNSTKRAAQNRAAQRAFRQRKEEYVRELERKAARLQQAEGQIMFLMARNQELEAKFAQQSGSSGSPLPSPLLPQDSPRGGMVGVSAGGLMDRGERDRDRDREWAIHERVLENSGSFDHYHPPGTRPALGRHSSVQHLRQAYNASSPPLSNSSMKHLSLSSKLSAQDSDQEGELQNRPHRHLHRHPSESSLNLHRSGSFPAFTTDPKDEDHKVAQRLLSFRGTPIDSRAETTSPTSTNRSPLPGSSGDIPMHYYPGSPLTPTHERSSLYSSSSAQNSRAPSSAGVGPRSLPSPTSATHGESSFPASSASSAHTPTPYHPSSSGYDLGKKRPSDGTVNWANQDLYKNPQETHSPSHHPYHSVKKQASWSSLSEQRRIHAVKKQPSYGSISEYRHSWRNNKTESPEMPSDARFGGSAGNSNGSDRGSVTPALPRIPPQFSQRPPQPSTTSHQQQPPSSFDREYPSPTAAAGTSSHGNNTGSTFSPPSNHSQNFHQQQQQHYSPSRSSAAAQHESHGSSDMDVVHENGSSGHHHHYTHQQQYQHQHHQEQSGYDSEDMDTYETRRESSHDQ